jgi:hypothetical protein
MLIGEVGFSPAKAGLLDDRPTSEEKDEFEPISKLALGLWRYSPRFPELVAVDAAGEPLLATHWGAYVLAEQTLFRVPESNRDLAAFLRYGFTDGKTNTLDYSFSAGLSFRGPFAGREKDTSASPRHVLMPAAGAGAVVGRTGPAAVVDRGNGGGNDLPGTTRARRGLQPVVQRIFNPGLYLPNATVAGVRLQTGAVNAGDLTRPRRCCPPLLPCPGPYATVAGQREPFPRTIGLIGDATPIAEQAPAWRQPLENRDERL